MVKYMFYAERILGDVRGTFFEKCYICENIIGTDPQQEHRIPKSANNSDLNLGLESNVFWACSRCNQKKGHGFFVESKECRYSYGYVGVIDCTKCDPNQYIKIKIGDLNNNYGITVTEKKYAPCVKHTISLLEEIYGCRDTIADIKLDNLKYLIQAEVLEFFKIFFKLQSEVKYGQSMAIINRRKEDVIRKLTPDSPFSAFKRTYLDEFYETAPHDELKRIMGEILSDPRINPNVEITCNSI